ncbi:MAG: cbb3-type cytochrome c oxidase subunit I [Acidimicrobiales bacterium]
MTVTEARPEAADAVIAAARLEPVPATGGIVGWLTTADHKRIGLLYIGFGIFGIAGSLVLSALASISVAAESNYLGDALVQVSNLGTIGLVFTGVVPTLLGLGLAIVPLQIGARAIAFPRAAALSLWGWLVGTVLMVASFVANGGPGGGKGRAVDLFLLAFGLVIVSLLLAALSLVTTLLGLRTAGMSLARTPMFAWSWFVTGAMLLVTLPLLVGVVIYLYFDHRYGRQIFGGNDGIVRYTGWAFRQPVSLLYALPVLGILADAVATATRQRQALAGVVRGGIGFAGIVAFGALNTAFDPRVTSRVVFIAVSVVAAAPVLVVLALALRNLAAGKPRLTAGFAVSVLGGLLLLGAAAVGILYPIERLDLVGTPFEAGQLHLALAAGIVGAIAGAAYWLPKLTGRVVPTGPAIGLGLLAALGGLLTGVGPIIVGFSSSSTQAGYGILAAGAFLAALAVAAFGLLALRSARAGASAGDDPFDGLTLEWATTSPPPPGNFAGELGAVQSAQPLLDRKEA